MKNKIFNILFYVLIFLIFLLYFSILWVNKTFGLINLDSLLFHLNVPLKGTASNMVISYIKDPFMKSFVILVGFIIINKIKCIYRIFINIKFFGLELKNIDFLSFLNKIKLIFPLAFLIYVIVFLVNNFSVIEYINSLTVYSNFIEENYVEPENTKIVFSEKRNLIHIFAESMESTYASKENGGAFDDNLIPNLTKYARNEISFTNNFGGGFYNSRATGWTIAAMVAQTSGIGFLVPGSGNDYGNYSKFLPGAYSIGQILEKEGYNQTLLIGSDGNFAGRNDYFKQHGNYVIKDYNYAVKNKWIPSNYHVWWGYEDSKLFEFAKKELLDLNSKDKPFNLTLLTTNTHHIGGYFEDGCANKYGGTFEDVIICSDKQIYDFVEWVKKQDFYNNTTIVITGDHLSMDPTFFDNIGDYERTNYNVFINTSKKNVNNKNRVFNSLDIYPTTVASIGGKIDGNRLGLGTNLFSNEKTLYEEYGKEYVDNEFLKNSKYFKNHIIYGAK